MNPVPTPLPQPVVLPQFEYPQAYDGRVAQDREKFETMLNLLKEYVSEYRDLPLQRTTYKGKVRASRFVVTASLS